VLGGQYWARIGQEDAHSIVWQDYDSSNSRQWFVRYLLRHWCRCERHDPGIERSAALSANQTNLSWWVDVYVHAVSYRLNWHFAFAMAGM
jgi:hypothetical protein